ncbi:hypothetical protein [Rosenbergiella metrosideri]|uniref:hypothetical protein n=1 Tax=Rosenbergiella metrosideri TaxID=2921185 RepID=UPI001F4F6636|nr:hypothetical protein [Rosenbergiella metrosideri]
MTRFKLPIISKKHGLRGYEDFEREAKSLTTAYRQYNEVKQKADEDKLKAEEARKVEEASKALFSSVGIMDAPSAYSAEMIRAANIALSESGALVLNRGPGMFQFSSAGGGSFPMESLLSG